MQVPPSSFRKSEDERDILKGDTYIAPPVRVTPTIGEQLEAFPPEGKGGVRPDTSNVLVDHFPKPWGEESEFQQQYEDTKHHRRREKRGNEFLWGLTGIKNMEAEKRLEPYGEELSYTSLAWLGGTSTAMIAGFFPEPVFKWLLANRILRATGLGRKANELAATPLGKLVLTKLGSLFNRLPKNAQWHAKQGLMAATLDTAVATVLWDINPRLQSLMDDDFVFSLKDPNTDRIEGLLSLFTDEPVPLTALEVPPFYAAAHMVGWSLARVAKDSLTDRSVQNLVSKWTGMSERELLKRFRANFSVQMDALLTENSANDFYAALDEKYRAKTRPWEQAAVPREPEHIAEEIPLQDSPDDWVHANPEDIELYGPEEAVEVKAQKGSVPEMPEEVAERHGVNVEMSEQTEKFVENWETERIAASLARKELGKLGSKKKWLRKEILGKNSSFRMLINEEVAKVLINEHNIDPGIARHFAHEAIVAFDVPLNRRLITQRHVTEFFKGMSDDDVTKISQLIAARIKDGRIPAEARDVLKGNELPAIGRTHSELSANFPPHLVEAEQSLYTKLKEIAEDGRIYKTKKAEQLIKEGRFDPDVWFPDSGFNFKLEGGSARALFRAVNEYADRAAAKKNIFHSLKGLAELGETDVIKIPPNVKDPVIPRNYEELSYGPDKIWVRKDLHDLMGEQEAFARSRWGEALRKWSGRDLTKIFATANNLFFTIRSIPMEAFAQYTGSSQRSKFFPRFMYQVIDDMKSTFDDVANMGPMTQAYLNSGGNMMQDYAVLSQTMKIIKDDGTLPVGWNEMNARQKIWAVAMHSADFAELWMRVSMFHRALGKGITPEKALRLSEQAEVPRLLRRAVHEARQYLDFEQGGRAIKFGDTVSPYLNAGIQYIWKSTNYAWKHPKTAAFLLFQGLAASYSNMLWNYMMNPKCYSKLSDGEKNSHMAWCLPAGVEPYLGFGKDSSGEPKSLAVKIPKTVPWMTLLVNPFERYLEQELYGVDNRDMLADMEDQLNRYSTGLIPPAAKATFSLFLNKGPFKFRDLYKGLVDPEYEQNRWRGDPVIGKIGEQTSQLPILGEFFTAARIEGSLDSIAFMSSWLPTSGLFIAGQINEMINKDESTFQDGWLPMSRIFLGLKGVTSVTDSSEGFYNLTKEATQAQNTIYARVDERRQKGINLMTQEPKSPFPRYLLKGLTEKEQVNIMKDWQMFHDLGRNRTLYLHARKLNSLGDSHIRGFQAFEMLADMATGGEREKRNQLLLWNYMKSKKWDLDPVFLRAFKEARQEKWGSTYDDLPVKAPMVYEGR